MFFNLKAGLNVVYVVSSVFGNNKCTGIDVTIQNDCDSLTLRFRNINETKFSCTTCCAMCFTERRIEFDWGCASNEL